MNALIPATCLSMLLLAVACSPDGSTIDDAATAGARLFAQQCALCHGESGNLGVGGAGDLTMSTLSPAETKAIILQGKGAMIGYKGALSDQQVDDLVSHVQTLR